MAGTWSLRRRAPLVVSLALGLAATTGVPAARADFAPTKLLRTADEVILGSIAAKGSGVGVVWQEPRPIGSALLYRMSADGGATFTTVRRLDTRPSRNPSAAVCAGTFWVASELHPTDTPDDRWDVVVDGFELDGPVESGYLITDPYATLTAAEPAVACVGSRFLAVVWLQRLEGAGWRARLSVFDPSPPLEPILPAADYEASLDLGPANPHVNPSIDATSGRIVVSWGRADELRFRRIDVASGGFVSLDASPVQVLASSLDHHTAVGISGAHVVVAYRRQNDLYTRHSANGGATFGAAVKRLDGDTDCCWIAFPLSVDLVGVRVLLDGGRAYGDLDPAAEEWRLRSTDGGATFSKHLIGTAGQRMGAFAGTAGSPRVVEAWDDWTIDAGDNHIRFHRES